MRPIKTLAAAVLAASFFTIPAFAAPAGRTPAAGHGHAKKSPAERAKQRQARRAAALKKAGVAPKRAQQALATMARFDAERKPVRAQMRKHMKALRALRKNKSQDKAAFKRERDAMKAGIAKLKAIRARERAALDKILTKAEQAKLKAMRHQHRKGHHRGHHHRGARK